MDFEKEKKLIKNILDVDSSAFNRSLALDYEQFLEFKDINREITVVRARRIIERVARKVHGKFIAPAVKKDLFEVIENLKCEDLINPIIYEELSMVNQIGNYGKNSTKLYKNGKCYEVSCEDIKLCEHAVLLFLEYYVENWLRKESKKRAINLKIIRGKEISFNRISEIAYLEKIAFANDIAVPQTILESWYNKNPDVFLCIEDLELNRIVGEICAIPLDDNTFNSTIKSDFDDRKLLPENIASYDLPDFYKLYLCSISVDPSYQNVTLAYKMLFDAYIDFLLELAKEDIFFIEASSMAVTNEGVKLCKSLNMKLKTEGLHNSKIFHVYLMPPAFKIASRKSVLLNRCYKNKYEEYKAIFDMNVS